MARHDVHPMPRGSEGLVLDVQTDLLAHLSTRAVVPLLPERPRLRPMRDLNPTFEVDGTRYVMMTQALASVPARNLGPPIGSLNAHSEQIIRALDILFTGV